jgi:phage gpG-like protein
MAKFGKNTRLKIVGGTLEVNMEGKGIDRWLARIQRFQLQAENLDEPFGKFGLYMLGVVERNFAAEGRPKWKPLNPDYAKWKAKHSSGGILVWSGKLRKSFRYRVTPRTLQIYSTSRLFPWHQEGVPQNNLPARPMVNLQPRDRAELSKLIRSHLYGN